MCRYRNCQSKNPRITVGIAAAMGASARRNYCSVTHAILGLLDILESYGLEATEKDPEAEEFRRHAIQNLEDLEYRMKEQRG